MWGNARSRGRGLLSGMERLAAWRPVAAMSLGIAALLWVAAALGATAVLDRHLRRLFYDLRGDRAPTAEVVLVAIDHDTVEAWGPPPWPWSRYERLIGEIARGRPRLIALLEPGPRVLPDDPPPAALRQDRSLVLPPRSDDLGQPRLALDRSGVVEAIDLGDATALGGLTVTATVIERAGLPGARRGRLLVDFFGPSDGFPAIAAHRVATGEIPPPTFRDRLVVIGTRGERFADLLPTPVGPLSASEIHAQALHALAGAGGLRPAPGWLAPLLALALIVLGLRAVPRPASQLVAVALVLTPALGLVALAYLAFRHAGVALDVAAPLLGLGLGSAAGLLHDRARAHRELVELARLAAQRLALEHPDREDDDEAFWRRFAEASRAYLGHEGAFFATLAVGAWHFEIAHADGAVAIADVVEPRRDVRRDPYRDAYLLRHPVWARRPFVREELRLRTLVVPLSAWRRMIGLWIVQFPNDRPLDEAIIERRAAMLGDELAFALDLRWVRRRLSEGGALQDPGALASRMVERARAARQNAFALVHAQDSRASLVDTLPVGVLTATVWGQVDSVNQVMRRLLAQCGVDLGRHPALGEVISSLTGIPPEQVRRLIQRLLDQGGTVSLEATARSALEPERRFDVVVARLAATVDGGPDRPIDRAHFAVTMSERGARLDAVAPDAWQRPSVITDAIDLRALIDEAIVEIRHRRGSAVRRPVELEGAASGPLVVADRGELRQGLAVLLNEYLCHGPADAASRVLLEEQPDRAIVRLLDPTSTLAAADARAVASNDSAFDPGSHLERLAQARRNIERAAGSFSIYSDLTSGTVIEIRLPLRDPGLGWSTPAQGGAPTGAA